MFVWNEDLPGLMEIQVTSEAMVNAKKANVSLSEKESAQIIDTFRNLNQDVRIQETASITFKGNQFLTHLKESVKSNSAGTPTQIGVHDAYEFVRTLDMIQKNKMQPLTDKQNQSISSIISLLNDKMEIQFQEAWSPPDRADAKTISKRIKAQIEKSKPLLLSENGFSNNETIESIKNKLSPMVSEFKNLIHTDLNILYNRIAKTVNGPNSHLFIPIHDLDFPIEFTTSLKQSDLFTTVTRQNTMTHLRSTMKPNAVASISNSTVSAESMHDVNVADSTPSAFTEMENSGDENNLQDHTVQGNDAALSLHEINTNTEPIVSDIVDKQQENQNQPSWTSDTLATSLKENTKPDGLRRKRPSWQAKAKPDIDKATKNRTNLQERNDINVNNNP